MSVPATELHPPGPGSDRPAANLRRSCVFCRTRKIRCSGESICSACQKRNLSCVYSPEAKKGRPKQKGTAILASLAHPNPTVDRETPRQLENGAGETYPMDYVVGDDLEGMFNIYFITGKDPRNNIFDTSIASYVRNSRISRGTAVPPAPPNPSYDGLLSFMACEMVGIVPLRFSHLGIQRSNSPHQNYYITSLAADTTPDMFDDIECPIENPMALGEHRILQLVDIWFSVHPLSPLVSKTLLTNDIQNGTVDEALLAIILADACEIHTAVDRPGDAHNDPSAWFQFAVSQLRQRSMSLADPKALSTGQALFLMSWRELCLGDVRRATCFMGYTCRITAALYVFWQEDSSRVRSRKFNGLDIGLVEQQILQNVYWLCLSITVWGFMQIDQPFSILTPENTPDFPCLNESASLLLRLDRASGNISTLQAQVQAIRCLWPLCHITSTVGHIYTLYLNESAEDKSAQSMPWQKQHLYEFHQLFQSCFDRSVLATRVRRILLQAIEHVKNKVTITSTRDFLLNAYHTLTIHMLFSADKKGDQPVISPSIIDSFCESTLALLAIAQTPMQPTGPMPTQTSTGLDATHMMVFGLDTCGRGLSYIYSRHAQGSTDERDTVATRQDQLASIADQLHQACKGDSVARIGSAISPVKKRFKRVKLAFQTLGFSSPSSTTTPSASSVQDSSSWYFANELLAPTFGLDLPVLDPTDSLGSFASLTPDMAMALPEPPMEVINTGFFGEPAAGSLLGFPGLVRANMQMQNYELPLEPDFMGLFTQT
ncbi:hypothetical protein BO70DRAFT_357992 [Aspergillus heteromorphus CBS 117.55]|uniref:Zn(2)-C6 fungal-type domain-containing protein n=1 Tax=Aspergillus heteromorphus CBS 117.55 TaxID=1448321 RepID=A0A317X2L2_9EURO|nr:uncharacterized protein BO70DRAFT_357992 [Aspergillus heteromorphus CBS 117.55]PWY92874.1 hypothetical protein BO70DRAFT_357992 [Aspergillus heteromorphus CBS 117.55]